MPSTPGYQLRTGYARPLDENYGNPYLKAQTDREERQKRLRLEMEIASRRKNTVKVVLWSKVCEIFDCDIT